MKDFFSFVLFIHESCYSKFTKHKVQLVGVENPCAEMVKMSGTHPEDLSVMQRIMVATLSTGSGMINLLSRSIAVLGLL